MTLPVHRGPPDEVRYDLHTRLRLLVELAAEWSERSRRPAVAAELRSALAVGADGPVRVVLAGETSTGKSALINALLDRPDLTPTGVGAVTACPVTFRAGPDDTATVTVADPATGSVSDRTIGVHEVADFVHVHAVPLAIRADVTLVHDLLAGLELVDTPGVGGLDSGYGELTLACLADADALLFAYETSTPLHQPELDFLTRAAARAANIVIAATKKDANPQYETVLAATAARLASEPRLAGVRLVPVSAALAHRAGDLSANGQGALADQLTAMSGLADLTAVLRTDVAARARRTRAANLARRTSTVLVEVATDLRASTAVGTRDDQAAVDQLTAEAERLKGLAEHEPDTRIGLTHRFQRLRSEPRQAFEDASTTLRHQYKDRLERSRRAALPDIPATLDGDIGAAAHRALVEQDRLVAELAEYLRTWLDVRDATEALTAVLADIPTGPPQLPGVGAPNKARGQAAFAMVSGLSLGRNAVAGASGLIGAVGLVGGGPVGWAGAAAGLAAMLFRNTQQSEVQLRGHINNWVAQAVNDARAAVARDLDRRAQAVQQHTEAALPGRLAALAEQRRRVLAARNTRRAQTAPDTALLAQLAEVEDGATRADALAAQLLAPIPTEVGD